MGMEDGNTSGTSPLKFAVILIAVIAVACKLLQSCG